MERQKRIKKFNDNGKDEANIRIELNNEFGAEHILSLEAETITLINGKIEYTKLDPKLVYAEHTDKNKDAFVFSMPNVKAGSIIDYRYMWARDLSRNFPAWDFQCGLPTRYSQMDVLINPMLTFSVYYRKNGPFVRDAAYGFGHVWALADIPSTKDEPYMRSVADILQDLTFIIGAVRVDGQTKTFSKSWAEVGKEIAYDKDFFKPFDQSLHDEDDLLKQTRLMKTDDEKIAYLFNKVKTLRKWNEEN